MRSAPAGVDACVCCRGYKPFPFLLYYYYYGVGFFERFGVDEKKSCHATFVFSSFTSQIAIIPKYYIYNFTFLLCLYHFKCGKTITTFIDGLIPWPRSTRGLTQNQCVNQEAIMDMFLLMPNALHDIYIYI